MLAEIILREEKNLKRCKKRWATCMTFCKICSIPPIFFFWVLCESIPLNLFFLFLSSNNPKTVDSPLHILEVFNLYSDLLSLRTTEDLSFHAVSCDRSMCLLNFHQHLLLLFDNFLRIILSGKWQMCTLSQERIPIFLSALLCFYPKINLMHLKNFPFRSSKKISQKHRAFNFWKFISYDPR